MMLTNGLILMKGSFECYTMKKNVRYGGSFDQFGAGNSHLGIGCDSSAEGSVLLLQGLTDIIDGGDGSKSGGGGSSKVSSGGVAGIVIAIAIIVGIIAAGVVYYFQRIKIDRLKNEIPASNSRAYDDPKYETNQSSDVDYTVAATEDPFDDV